MKKFYTGLLGAGLLLPPASLMAAAGQDVDLAVIHQIKDEAFERSQVMDDLFYLTDVNGPRLTNSPGYQKAAQWAVDRLKSYGVANAGLEPWGEFGRGWSYSRLSVQLKEPVESSLVGVPLAWCSGTNGPVTAEVVLAPFGEREREMDLARMDKQIQEYIEQYRGKLKGRIVLVRRPRDLSLPTKAEVTRLEDKELATTVLAPDPSPTVKVDLPITHVPSDPREREALFRSAPDEAVSDYFDRLRLERFKLAAFLRDEGVVAVLSTDERGDGGLIFAESIGLWNSSDAPPVPSIVLEPEHYNRLSRMVQHNIPVKLEIDLAAKFTDGSTQGNNVVAELPGGKKKNEVVMLGAHLDSWHASTGATDNGAGSAVVLEAMRILKALNLKMDRTVRLALWGGEEQGLLGSRGYVKNHFGDPITMSLKPEHARLAGYFNLDNGSGKIRGIYLQGNDMVRPIFEEWLGPFRDQGATTITIRGTGGTDHESFDAVGLPGFQFLQDPLEYRSRTHHSSLDAYDHANAADLMQASAIMAAFIYEAANRPEMLPRKALPKPVPAGAIAGVGSSSGGAGIVPKSAHLLPQ